MKVPSWLLTRNALFAVIALVVSILIVVWFYQRDARIRREAVLEQEIAVLQKERAKQDTVEVALRDTLRLVKVKTDTIVRFSIKTVTEYKTIRETVDTSRTAQPPGTPEGMTLVPTAFIAKADEAIAQVPILLERIRVERFASDAALAASDSSKQILLTENAKLRMLAGVKSTKWTDRLRDLAIGVAIGYGGAKLAGN